MALGLGASAQRSGGYFSMGYGTSTQHDGFFSDWNNLDYGTSTQYGGFLSGWNELGNGFDRDPGYPGHGGGDTPAPLGSGALLLIGFGAAYALKKKSSKR